MRRPLTQMLIILSLLSASGSFGQPLSEAQRVVANATPEQKAKWLAALKEEHDQAEEAKNKLESLSQACGVGYLPSQFAGKPDPWPNNIPLPNDELLAAYIARYGQPPGSGGSRIGYCCELFGLNYEALENAANDGASGPTGERLHPGCASTTEATDGSFSIPRGGPYIGQWVAAKRDGGTPERAVVVHEAANPCGPYSTPNALFGAYPLYFNNQPPCGEIPPACGNGKVDPGETCVTCPQDVGVCPTCGNGQVDPGETCDSCPQDVGACTTCGNGKVDPGETCTSCPQDVGACATCGNGKVDPGETCTSCPQDVGACPTCGNGKVDPGESCVNCPQDAGACPPPACEVPKVCMIPPDPCPALTAVPLSAKDACKQLLTWYRKGTGRYRTIHDACEVIGRAEAYKPGV
jgi:hypothetical protein